jgi:hypothetical protein
MSQPPAAVVLSTCIRLFQAHEARPAPQSLALKKHIIVLPVVELRKCLIRMLYTEIT